MGNTRRNSPDGQCSHDDGGSRFDLKVPERRAQCRVGSVAMSIPELQPPYELPDPDAAGGTARDEVLDIIQVAAEQIVVARSL